MKIEIFETEEELGLASAEKMRGALRQKPQALLCIAAGNTQEPMLATLAAWHSAGQLAAGQARFTVLDEWVGLDEHDAGSCQNFMWQRLFIPLGVDSGRIRKFDAKNPNLDEECQKADVWLDENGPVDLLFLGVGMNGHVGFNEPGSLPGQRTYYRDLDEVTSQVGQKYFSGIACPQKGITMGLKDLLAAKKVVLQVSGAHKRPMLAKALAAAKVLEETAGAVPAPDAEGMLQGTEGGDFPTVARFMCLPNCVLMVDRAAAGDAL